MSDLKPELDIITVDRLLENYYGSKIQELQAVPYGHLKQVYFFSHSDKCYVIRFSRSKEEFEVEYYLYESFKSHGLVIPPVLHIGSTENLYFSICERALGTTLNKLTEKEVYRIMPSLIDSIAKIHWVNVSSSKGYGWIDSYGNGFYDTWQEYLLSFYQEEQEGFWKGWYDLFENSFLERDIFQQIYIKMIELSKYCENQRHLIHGDCHFGNIVSDAHKITGIIDWGNVMYGDFLYDIAAVNMQFPKYNFPKLFREYYESKGIQVPYFKERFLCTSYCKGLDSLRFFAKINRKKSYNSIRDYLLNLKV